MEEKLVHLNESFSFYRIQFLFHFRGGRRLLLFNGILFAQEILKELILLCMDYYETLWLENIESKKVNTLKTTRDDFIISSFNVTTLFHHITTL